MKRTLRKIMLWASVLALAVSFLGLNYTSVRASDENDCDQECRKTVASVRAATAQYHDVNRAIADGFVQASPCVELTGVGAMGFHFANFARILDPSVSPDEPEVLLYFPEENGRLRLVGVEYVVPAPLTTTVPTLFGQDFHFNPMRNQYDLHVWIWRNNPDGIFSDFNPKLRCPTN